MSVEQLKAKGNELFKQCKYQEAIDLYTEGLRLDPQHALLYSNRSLAHLKAGHSQRALKDGTKCAEVRPQWAKGHLRRASALDALGRNEEVLAAAEQAFKVSSDGKMRRESVKMWLCANQKLNKLSEGSIDLPRGISICSKEYLTVLAYLMRSLSGEVPLNQSLMEQCLFSCGQQIESLLIRFGEAPGAVISDWLKHLPSDIFPYSPDLQAKCEIEKANAIKNQALCNYINKEIDPALYPVLQPVFGLIVLVVLNRTNIFCECNTGHHAAELMNSSLLPLFESSILKTEDYCSMHTGRLCAILDSFVGRGYQLSSNELEKVKMYCSKLKSVLKKYPQHLPEYAKDKNTALLALNNIEKNVLLPSASVPPSLPQEATMSVEVAEREVKKRPGDVTEYVTKHLAEIEAAKFLGMRDVEDLLTMTGIYLDLGDRVTALKMFSKGEGAFFTVFSHLLSTNSLKLDESSATITPIRQLVFSEISLLNAPDIHVHVFADILLRWKGLFTEFRNQLIRNGLGKVFKEAFEWYFKCQRSEQGVNSTDIHHKLLEHLQREEDLLQAHAKPVLRKISQRTYADLQNALDEEEAVLDYIFFATKRENPLLEGFCCLIEKTRKVTFCRLDYLALRKLSAVIGDLLSLGASKMNADPNIDKRIKYELCQLSKIILPDQVHTALNSGRIKHLYISPDKDLSQLPLDLLPICSSESQLMISLVSSSHQLLLLKESSLVQVESGASRNPALVTKHSTPKLHCSQNLTCYIIADPNYDLQKSTGDDSWIQGLMEAFLGYVNISSPLEKCLCQLPHCKEEAESVLMCLSNAGLTVKLLMGDKATVSNVTAISNPLLIHISTHAIGSTGSSAYRQNFYSDLKSTLALAGYNTYLQQPTFVHPEAGIGQLPALAACSLNLQGTKLVFLSMCTSAVGTSTFQEAVGSLSESFFSAGAETVIATLWPIEDLSAFMFSEAFYKKLVERGVRPSQALAYAKSTLASGESQKHWSFWAGFVCYGLDKPLIQ